MDVKFSDDTCFYTFDLGNTVYDILKSTCKDEEDFNRWLRCLEEKNWFNEDLKNDFEKAFRRNRL